ncbi:MAG: PAQR family membrane homeostasis protein TrhA [Plesiomonas sp.]
MSAIYARLDAEEVANSISHALGIILGAVGLFLLLKQGMSAQQSFTAIFSYTVYGISMIMLFLASTLYHAATNPVGKHRLKIADHCAIYLLIAGTYTPFLLVALQSSLATYLMAVIWGLALSGIIFKLLFIHRFEVLSVITYLLMGWLSLVVIYQLAESLSLGGLLLLAGGGVLYSLGVVFYLSKRLPFSHAIWHLFVLGGAMCHFFAIYFYVAK